MPVSVPGHLLPGQASMPPVLPPTLISSTPAWPAAFLLPYPSLPCPELVLSSTPGVFLYGPVHSGPCSRTSRLPCLALTHVCFSLCKTAATAPSEFKALFAWAALTSASPSLCLCTALPCPALTLLCAHPNLAACQVITSLCSPWPQLPCQDV